MTEKKTEPAATAAPILPPEMIIKRDTVFAHKEDIQRVLMDKLPGHISDISRGGQWPGCRLIEFWDAGDIVGLPEDINAYITEKCPNRTVLSAVEMVNKFFELFANYLVVDKFSNGEGAIVVEYTSMLDTEDTQDLQEVSDAIRKEMNKKRAERKAAREEAEAKAAAETEELLKLGRAAKEHNVIEKNREYINEIHELRNEIKKLKRVAAE